jgi:hypothetical protein
MLTRSATTTRPGWASTGPYGRPQRRPGQQSGRRRPLVPETTAEYFYDYAGQDPINGYDLTGTMTGGRGAPGCQYWHCGIDSGSADDPFWSTKNTIIYVVSAFAPEFAAGGEALAGTRLGLRAQMAIKERGAVAAAAKAATPANASRLQEAAHVAAHVAYPEIRRAVTRAGTKAGPVVARRARAGAAIGLRQLGRP